MPSPLTVVDAFTDVPFRGNPAAVCLLDDPRDAGWMAAVAAETNLSETAFVLLDAAEADALGLRWFTPRVEVDLCGHATLAAAHVLWTTGRVPDAEPIAFATASGRVGARRTEGWIELDFPAEPVAAADPDPGLLAALGVAARYVGRNRLDHLVEVDSPEEVASCRPDLARLAALGTRGVIVTAAGGRHDFVSRYFAPAVGVPEDPVTGSAHCALGPYWAGRLGREDLAGEQVSARGGVVRVRPGDEPGRVVLGGRAVTVMSATLHV